MEKVNGIEELLQKIEQLKDSIQLNEEILPLISDMFLFIKDIIPLMLEVNAFMKEGATKVPSAADNLTKVSKTTEMATQEVMDHLEHIIAELDVLKANVLSCDKLPENIHQIENIQNEVQNVFYSFQFQDITNQQLEYVNRILKAIYVKFVDLFNSSLKIKGNTILGKGLIDAIEKELEKTPLTVFENETNDMVRQNEITQDSIDKFFK